ncbi:MAG: hypothetical protein ACYSUB_01905 [Planctomycetota bacterium]|jgi:hypothetical protein
MCLGYHYTTRENYDNIIRTKSLLPVPVHPQHNGHFNDVKEQIQEGAIWLFKQPQLGIALVSVIFMVAVEHDAEQICLLEVEYRDHQAVSTQAAQLLEDDTYIRLSNTFTMGNSQKYGHWNEPIELLNQPVPLERIKLSNQWDLRDLINR